MAKFTLLIFSKDDLDQALELTRGMHSVADEIVLMDASGKKEREHLLTEKEKLGLNKLKVFRVLALGYREPLMMYALKKCRNRWVLALNTDEQPSEVLKRGIYLLANQNVSGFSISLFGVHSERERTFISSQVRLFDKNRTEFRGLVHELPIVHGKTVELDGKVYYIDHMTGMVHSARTSYSKMELFDRLTYEQYNRRVLDLLSRSRSMRAANHSIVLGLLRLYQALGLKRPDQEASSLDYFMLILARDVAHQIRRRRPGGVIAAFPGAYSYVQQLRKIRNSPQGARDFEIAQRIREVGVTKYLNLDSERTVESLTRRYANKKQGVELLIKLLRDKVIRRSLKRSSRLSDIVGSGTLSSADWKHAKRAIRRAEGAASTKALGS